ncbi:preprotein translocase subunit SecA [Candidatus Collierbacteria bacterium]|nr:preprotein translocase subunit SecA [Candidatus Collierbacteria bacterium]
MFNLLGKLFDTNTKEVEKLKVLVDQINCHEDWAKKFKDSELKAQIQKFKNQLEGGTVLDDILPEVFALSREASVRTLKMRPFDVQLMAGITFHQGKIAEQKTGEGKTLSAVAAVVLNALTGRGVHLVTVNDYLARRDAGWMGPVYHLLGLSVGVIFSGKGDLPAAIYDPDYIDATHSDDRLKNLRPVSRREAYAADITYGTNNEFGFDYLRDNMARATAEMVQRSHHFAIVDEVDSILIDEARTPLIISAPDSEPTEKYYRFSQIIDGLSKDTDYEIDEKLNTANLTEHGLRKVEKIMGVDNLYEKDFDTLHHIEQALKARTLFIRDREYIVKDDQIIIVDEHTGRLMYGRRYSEGLHQAIEAKENVKIQQESRTLATISLQNYFRMYGKLAGMTGTAATEAEEFRKIYKLDVVIIPTHVAVARTDFSDMVFKSQRAKYSALTTEVEEKWKKGQPILIGTKSIEQNEIVSKYLKHKRVDHQVLNAKNHESEAEIISRAGEIKAVTVATNIAGRGVDIVLGGDPTKTDKKTWQKNHDEVVRLGGLHIIGAVRHESRRIDNQFRGRAGRQGDPGSSRFYVSLEDDIMRIFGGEQISKLMDFLKVPEEQPLEAGMVSRAIETAQAKVESFYFDQRKSVVEYDDVMNKQREIFYKRRFQALTDSESEKGLSDRIDEIIKNESTSLCTLYSPEGIDAKEAERIGKEFQMILPLDNRSAKGLEKRLSGTDEKTAQETLLSIITQARKSQTATFGTSVMRQIENFVILGTYDELWMDHLDAIDDLRDGIRLRGYAQKDPLVEYKQEAYNMFETLLNRINNQIARKIFRFQPTSAPPPPLERLKEVGEAIKKKKVGRNDPCWCSSGKKWKDCHYPDPG